MLDQRSSSPSCYSTSSRKSDSVFSSYSTSTARSSCPSSPSQADDDDFHRQGVDPELKAKLLHIPLKLPPAPKVLSPVDVTKLILDDDLKMYPVGLVIDCLSKRASHLQKAALNTCINFPPSATLPSYLECATPTSQDPTALFLAPTHVLSITSQDSPRRLVISVHGLLFATFSPVLSILSSVPNRQPRHPSLPSVPSPPTLAPNDPATIRQQLAVISILLPSSLAFPVLQRYIYNPDPQELFSTLLPRPSPSSLSHLLNPSPQSLSLAGTKTLVSHIKLLHGLWQDVVALEIADEKMWQVMSKAWMLLVGALAILEDTRRKNSIKDGLEKIDNRHGDESDATVSEFSADEDSGDEMDVESEDE